MAVGWVVSVGTGLLAFQRLGDRTKDAQETAGIAKTLVNALESRMGDKLEKLEKEIDERLVKQEERYSSLLSAIHNNCTTAASDLRAEMRDFLPRQEFEDFNRRHSEAMLEMRRESSDGRREVLDSIKHLDDRLLTFIRGSGK